MRRVRLLVAVLVGTSACSNAPISYLVGVPGPADAAYSCALRKVNELGFTVTNTNREAGFITAEKQTSGIGTKLLTGAEYHEQMTVSVFGDSASGGRKIRATVGRTNRQANLFGTSTQTQAPSQQEVAEANDLLLACGSGPVSKQGDATRMSLERAALVEH